jgi:hypothetical protein
MSEFDLNKIKIKYKYYLFELNRKSILSRENTKKQLEDKKKKELEDKKKKELEDKKKKITNLDSDLMIMKLEKMKDWKPNSKYIGGPIKITFSFYTISKKNKLKKVEDKRAVQIIYYTWDYYQKNKIKSSDLKKIAFLAFQNKLEKRLLAQKLISQIL